MRRTLIFFLVFFAFAASSTLPVNTACAKLVKIQLEEPRAIVEKKWLKVDGNEIPEWIANVGKLYMRQSAEEPPDKLLAILEENLGVKSSGVLDLIRAWESGYDLSQAAMLAKDYSGEDAPWLLYIKDLFSLTGFNYIYFQTCMLHREGYGERFIRYFENGFYPNRNLFSRSYGYYRTLYYYLLLVTNDLFDAFGKATRLLNRDPSASPGFISDEDIYRFGIATRVALELDDFMPAVGEGDSLLSEKIFSPKEIAWIRNTVKYYSSTETHSALMSFEWFRKKIPFSISAEAISHDIKEEWRSQALAYRRRLPLMFFVDEGEQKISIESLFGATLEKFRIDNRAVDVMVMTALKTWLAKQVRHGLRIEDRMVYNTILAELKECPTGWIFANLYDCREDLDALKRYSEGWDRIKNPQYTFTTEVMERFLGAKEKMDRVFDDLEKIFGKQKQGEKISYLFYKYRGEIYYYFKHIRFDLYGGKGPIIPAAGPEDNFLRDFQIAFVKAPDNPQNHINLINGYDLLFQKLFAEGRVGDMQRMEAEMHSFIRGEYKLGGILSHKENNLYNIYRVLTNAYLSAGDGARALENAKAGFELARRYYVAAAAKTGFVVDGRVGAITVKNTEMDDYQRQFELYRDVAESMGKKIRLLLPQQEIDLYNRMVAMRNAGS